MKTDDIKKIIKEGTIVITRRKLSLYVHMGIVAIEGDQMVIYDVHMEHINEKEGNIEFHFIEDYMARSETLIGIYPTNTTTERIKEIAKQCWTKKYDTYSFNCQKFIDEVTNNEVRSDLYSFYSGILITGGILGLALVGTLIGVILSKGKKQ